MAFPNFKYLCWIACSVINWWSMWCSVSNFAGSNRITLPESWLKLSWSALISHKNKQIRLVNDIKDRIASKRCYFILLSEFKNLHQAPAIVRREWQESKTGLFFLAINDESEVRRVGSADYKYFKLCYNLKTGREFLFLVNSTIDDFAMY